MWFDQQQEVARLTAYFHANGAIAGDFGRRVWQTFEAVTFANVIRWYQQRGWQTSIHNPIVGGRSMFRMKYNTRGDPGNFTFVRCTKGSDTVQIRHQIRVETKHNTSKGKRVPRANVVCDVAVLRDGTYHHLKGYMHVYNRDLITFAEAKHMDAYAELIAGFIGLVHELQPRRLARGWKTSPVAFTDHPVPFLNVSGVCMHTAQGLKATIRRRGLGIAVHDAQSPFS